MPKGEAPYLYNTATERMPCPDVADPTKKIGGRHFQADAGDKEVPFSTELGKSYKREGDD